MVLPCAETVRAQTNIKQIATGLILLTLLVAQNSTGIATTRKLHHCYFDDPSSLRRAPREGLRRRAWFSYARLQPLITSHRSLITQNPGSRRSWARVRSRTRP